jgi:hypothetical protein
MSSFTRDPRSPKIDGFLNRRTLGGDNTQVFERCFNGVTKMKIVVALLVAASALAAASVASAAPHHHHHMVCHYHNHHRVCR